MPIYPDHLQNGLVYGRGLLIFQILALFWLGEKGSNLGLNLVSGHFQENPLRKWSEIYRADVVWSLSELIRLWSQFVDFVSFMALIWLSETGQNLGFRAFWSCSIDFLHYGVPLTETGHIWGFWALSQWRRCRSKCREGSGGIFLTLCVEFCVANFTIPRK